VGADGPALLERQAIEVAVDTVRRGASGSSIAILRLKVSTDHTEAADYNNEQTDLLEHQAPPLPLYFRPGD
jgi:hypothetical protein